MQELLKIRDTIQAEYEYHVNACDPQGMVEGLHMALILIDEHKDRLCDEFEVYRKKGNDYEFIESIS